MSKNYDREEELRESVPFYAYAKDTFIPAMQAFIESVKNEPLGKANDKNGQKKEKLKIDFLNKMNAYIIEVEQNMYKLEYGELLPEPFEQHIIQIRDRIYSDTQMYNTNKAGLENERSFLRRAAGVFEKFGKKPYASEKPFNPKEAFGVAPQKPFDPKEAFGDAPEPLNPKKSFGDAPEPPKTEPPKTKPR